MKSEELKQKLHQYINEASDEQLEDMLSYVEEEAAEYGVKTQGAPWDDPEFVKEMDRRMEELDSGKVKAIPAEEVHAEMKAMLANIKKR